MNGVIQDLRYALRHLRNRLVEAQGSPSCWYCLAALDCSC
jgi:hypothetical protein